MMGRLRSIEDRFAGARRALLAAWAIAIGLAAGAWAQESPRLAERGVEAYRSGKLDLARVFFAKAWEDAVLKGKEEWIAKAAFNLADLELESGNEAEAARLLEGIAVHDVELRPLHLWKLSQAAFALKRGEDALGLIDSALALEGGGKWKSAMRADRLRYLIALRDPADWEGEFGDWNRSAGRAGDAVAASVRAAAEMARGRFARADTLWREAVEEYRRRGRLAMVAACLNQTALCLFADGRRAEAVEANGRAVAVYGQLGLELPGLKAQALRLYLLDDRSELAKLRRDMDLVGQRLSGFDLQGILDEYSQSLRGGRGPGGVVGP